jgi:hypothetical protein
LATPRAQRFAPLPFGGVARHAQRLVIMRIEHGSAGSNRDDVVGDLCRASLATLHTPAVLGIELAV